MLNILGNKKLEYLLALNFGVSRNCAKKMVHEVLKIRRLYFKRMKWSVKNG